MYNFGQSYESLKVHIMKLHIYIMGLAIAVLLGACSQKKEQKPEAVGDCFTNPLFQGGSSPSAVFYKGKYYYTHETNDMIWVWETSDITDMKHARIALVTSGGIVPKGNPDHIESSNAQKYGSYCIDGVDTLDADHYETAHGGYDPSYANENPNRVVPLDVVREMEKNGEILSYVGDWLPEVWLYVADPFTEKFPEV